MSTSTSLLEQVRQKNEQAWRDLTQIYAPSVYRWCRNAGLQAADAADVVQEVFLSVAVKIDDFRKDREGDSFRGWLWTVFRSKLMDHFRRRKAQPPVISPDAYPALFQASADSSIGASSGDSAGGESDEVSIVRGALRVIEQDFSDRTWQAFWRSAILNQRTCDIATELEMTTSAVCMCRARVLKRLRETLGDLDRAP